MSQPINDRAIELLIDLAKTVSAAEGINDFGEATGFCDELDQLTNDTFHSFVSLRSRAHKLRRRIEKHKEAQEAPAP